MSDFPKDRIEGWKQCNKDVKESNIRHSMYMDYLAEINEMLCENKLPEEFADAQ